MKSMIRSASALVFLIGVLLLFDNRYELLNNVIPGLVLSIGIIGVYFSTTNYFYKYIVVFTGIFVVGMILTLNEFYLIFNIKAIIIQSVFLWIGISFFLIYITDYKNVAFLISAVFLVFIGLMFSSVWKNSLLVMIMNSYISILLDFWYLLMFMAGIILLGVRRKV